jgi:hypothetical protein
LVRRFLEVVFAARSRWHLARLDEADPARAQLRALLGLVHHARATPFGREHDFLRIRSAADFRRLVPLRTPAELWREYGHTGGAWPGPHSFLAAPHPVPGEYHRPVVLSPGLLASQRQALRTAMALVLHERPRARLLGGPILWLGDELLLSTLEGGSASPAGLVAARFPRCLRPAAQADFTIHHESPTCLVGPAERLAALLAQVRAISGEPVWPGLTAAIYSRRDPSFDRERLRLHLSPATLALEMLSLPEGPVAIEDPRYGGLRLLADHGVYFEFVPAGQADQVHPSRLGLDEVKVGVVYELAITSPAGVWACRSGLHVCFDHLSPPLLRVVSGSVRGVSASRRDGCGEWSSSVREHSLMRSTTAIELPVELPFAPEALLADVVAQLTEPST